ncbi:MAG: transporter ATP-binding protein [Aeromicrobium sp.]|nr:transporter ATP-binding protein [Aeromicrobium sp.]
MTTGEITFEHVTKTFGTVRAVDDLSITVRPGRVTGFLGPNGAGKTTLLRMLLGLVEPTAGRATIGGRAYAEIEQPANTIGAALEAAGFHPGRSGRDHLRSYAPLIGASDARCGEVLDIVGMAEVADRRVGGYSLGMRQRLALATTLLGDPQVLVLDEPANGLDPQGIAWLRVFLRHLAGEGRTVLVSSHVLSEVQQTVDDVVIIAGGRLVHASTLDDLVALADRPVHVSTPDRPLLDRLASEHGWTVVDDAGHLELSGASAADVGAVAFRAGLELHTLVDGAVDLEAVFLRLTGQDRPTAGAAPRAVDA